MTVGHLTGYDLTKSVLRDNHILEDGPGLVSFLKKPMIIEVKSKEEGKSKELQLKRTGKSMVSPPEYLLFLKQRKDGNYEPVSGQLDAAFSVRALLPPNNIKAP